MVVSYENFGNETVLGPPETIYSIRIDVDDPDTTIATLQVARDGTLIHCAGYVSAKEFATVAMKQALTIYVKRRVIELHPDKFTQDDPRLHAYVSRLSYEGIKYVATKIEQFADEFLSGKITMKIPQHTNYNKLRH